MMSDGEGFLWLLALGSTVWAWNNHEKLKTERDERIYAVQRAETRNADLETRIMALEREVEATKTTVGIATKTVSSVADQVSKNARVANDNAIADMTAAGACGRETIYFENGGYTVRNKQCTVKDLR